jgi:hypothetical protein
MTTFGQNLFHRFELLAIGIGNVNDLNIKELKQFCDLVDLQKCSDVNDDQLKKKINKYLLHLTPSDFIQNMKILEKNHAKNEILELLDSNLKAQTIELTNFNNILENLKTNIKNIKQPSPELQMILNDILGALKI